ncbi:oligomeric golgi complex component, COG2-domain-containing protein [Lipomyces oligophaga]|uniref:oligomeric golgi complex component, COG2-domain-containing protein n=1 Tax=Lipomyces oligophaga TaxID=45792 RepID=UPI0034CD9A04
MSSRPSNGTRSGISNSYQFIEDDDYDENYNNEDDTLFNERGLPFPQPIQRSAFSTPAQFDPDAFLVSQHRYQRLEDLHNQLTTWSSTLQKELVELINKDYADFVGLGKSVSGGEAKVEDMKLAIIAFQREVEGICVRLQDVIHEIDDLLSKKQAVLESENLGRSLLLYSQRIDLLERSLASADSISLDKILFLCSEYSSMTKLRSSLDPSHPFLVSQLPRQNLIQSSLLVTLKSSLKSYSSSTSSNIHSKFEGYGDIFRYLHLIAQSEP